MMKNINNINRLIYILMALVPLVIIPSYSDLPADFFYFPKLIAFMILALLMAGIHISSEKRRKIHHDGEVKFLFLYLILVGISTIFSINPINSIWGSFRREEGLITILMYGLLFLLAKHYFSISKKGIDLILLGASLVAMYGILQYFGFDPIPRDEIRMSWTGRAFSTIGNPNFLGSYLVLMLPIGMYSFINERKKWHLLATTILYTCLLVTFTRSAYLGFGVIFVSFVVVTVMNKPMRKPFTVLLVVFAIITVIIDLHSKGNIFSRFISIGRDAYTFVGQTEGYEYTGANRGYIWTRTFELLKERPLLGFGLETLDIAFVERYRDEMMQVFGSVYPVDKAHNEYLHIAVVTGIPAVLSYLLFLGMCIKKGINNLLDNKDYIPFFIATFAYLAQAFFNVSVVSVAPLAWVLFGGICYHGESTDI